jgi:hypothetical protein
VKALEVLPDSALVTLVAVTNLPGPAQAMAPRYFDYLGDVVAVEVARRRGEDLGEPPFPLELTSEELEAAALALMAMGGADRPEPDHAALSTAFRAIAADLMTILADRLRPTGTIH